MYVYIYTPADTASASKQATHACTVAGSNKDFPSRVCVATLETNRPV